MRKAFGLAQALMIILFIGSLVLMGIKYSRAGVDHYADTYIAEQAKLFLQSTKEWALYQISGEKCWKGGENKLEIKRKTSDVTIMTFNAHVEVEKYYLLSGTDDALNNCDKNLIEIIQAPESHGMVKLKITITDSLGKIKIINRSIQRP